MAERKDAKMNDNGATLGFEDKPWTAADNALNDDLAKIPVYNAAKAHEIQAWVDIRNKGAHGKGSEIKIDDVTRMEEGIRAFMGEYLR
jgi:hypothetical protein